MANRKISLRSRVKFEAVTEAEGIFEMSIDDPTRMKDYNDKSFEELRYEDYLSDKNGLRNTTRLSCNDDDSKVSISNNESTSNGGKDCQICCESKSGIFAFVPCGHAIACEDCCVKLTFGGERCKRICPICREKIVQYIKVFV